MKLAELQEAKQLADERYSIERLLNQIKTDPLDLVVGNIEVQLTKTFKSELIGLLMADRHGRLKEIDNRLRELGVDP